MNNKNNKKILVTQSSIPTYEEYCNEIKDIWETKWLTNNGEKHDKLAEKLREYLNVDNLTLFVNGHMALYNAIKVLDLKGEVITTPFTFSSTTHTIVQNGLKPVFCDINEKNYNIDVNKIEGLITDKTCAILAVHVYGNPCDVDAIQKIADKHNLKVIYDAAHAFGIKYNGKSIGNYGDISMFSFHATKVFNTIEGGALVYHNSDYKQVLNELKNFGIVDYETVGRIGMNCKMNEFQAAMGLCNLKHIDSEKAKRKKVYERYVANLQEVKGLKIIIPEKNLDYNYAYFPVLVTDDFYLNRDELYLKLQNNDIYTRKYFYPLITDYDCYKNDYNSSDTPIAKKVASQIITLPMYANLSLEDVDRICEIIKNNSED